MDKQIIPFDSRKESEVDAIPLTTFIGWERLRRALDHSIALEDNEKIAGLIIEKNGITIKLETAK